MYEDDIVEYLLNKNDLKKINNEISKALRRTDSKLDYIPTQYISDFIKSIYIDKSKDIKYSGIEYKSTVSENGFNLAVYYPNHFECKEVNVLEIQKIDYNYNEI